MTPMKVIILLVLGTGLGAGLGFLAARLLLQKLVGKYKPSASAQLEQVVNERLATVNQGSAAAFTEKSAARIRTWVQKWYQQNSDNPMPLREAMQRVISAEAVGQMADGFRQRVTGVILQELPKHDPGASLSRVMVERVRSRLPAFMTGALSAVEAPMALAINHTINEYAPELVDKELGRMEERLLDMPLAELAEKGSLRADQVLDTLTQLCVAACNEHMEALLQSADMGQVIAHSVEALADEQLDTLWKNLVDKEQKLLVVLGGLVGFAASGLALLGTLL